MPVRIVTSHDCTRIATLSQVNVEVDSSQRRAGRVVSVGQYGTRGCAVCATPDVDSCARAMVADVPPGVQAVTLMTSDCTGSSRGRAGTTPRP